MRRAEASFPLSENIEDLRGKRSPSEDEIVKDFIAHSHKFYNRRVRPHPKISTTDTSTTTDTPPASEYRGGPEPKQLGPPPPPSTSDSLQFMGSSKMPANSTTGDIIWKRLDPKTWELYNETPEPAPPPAPDQASSPASTPTKPSGSDNQQYNETEKAMFQHDMANYGPMEAVRRATRHHHMRLLGDFDHDLKRDPNMDIQKRMQELFDSGALRLDENGDLWSPTVKLGPHANERILEASRIWQPPTRDSEEEMSDDPTRGVGDMRSSIEQEIAQTKSGIGGEEE